MKKACKWSYIYQILHINHARDSLQSSHEPYYLPIIYNKSGMKGKLIVLHILIKSMPKNRSKTHKSA